MAEAGVDPKKSLLWWRYKSSVWTQVVSDVLGKDSIVSLSGGAPLGAAYLAGLGLGIIPEPAYIRENYVKTDRVVIPSMAAGKRYEEYYQVYRLLYKETKDLMGKLAGITNE